MADMNQLLIAGSNVDISNAIRDPTSNGNVTGRVGAHGLDVNHENPVSGIVPVTAVDGNNNVGMELSTSHPQDDSLALNLNLALAPDQLPKASTHASSHDNGGTGTAVNTGNNSNATTTMPTPINISRGSNSIDGSIPGTNKSTGLSGLRTNIHNLTSNASSPVVSNGLSTNTVRMFQRMDEMSARLIAMEEMFQKLCKTIDHQSTTISDLRQENEKFYAELSKKIDELSQTSEQAKDTTDQDSFVTDLLNSITNVSSTYLRKIRSRTDMSRKFKSMDSLSELNQHFLPQYHNNQQQNTQTQQQINHNSSSTALQNYGDRRSSTSTFTLNPEGIKRRKKNDIIDISNVQNQPQVQSGSQITNNSSAHVNSNVTHVNNNVSHVNSNVSHSGFHSNVPSGSQSYTDLNSLNAFGTISLPNLTLENTGITPLLKYGSNGMHFPKLHDNATGSTSHGNSNNILQQTQPIHHDQNKTQLSKMIKNTKNASFAVGLDEPTESGIVTQASQHPDHNADEENDDEDDDGYQEDDDDDNEDDDEEDDDEEDDEEDEEDADDKEEAGFQRNGNRKSIKKRKTKGASLEGLQVNKEDATNKTMYKAISATERQSSGSGGPNNGINNPIKNRGLSNSYAANKPRDMNYTLLKAPSNVRTIWEEYSHGIDGNPPIKGLEEKYGNKWRLNRNRKTFARRKRLYKFILNGITKGKTPDEMINILEERRLYKDENGEVKRRTIGWLQQSLTGI